MGRWLNRDPINEKGGVNLFHYVFNNSIYYIDSDGQGSLGPPDGGPGSICWGNGVPYYPVPSPPDPGCGPSNIGQNIVLSAYDQSCEWTDCDGNINTGSQHCIKSKTCTQITIQCGTTPGGNTTTYKWHESTDCGICL